MQNRQLQIVGTKIVAPLRHAVRLVDGEQGDAGAADEIEAARRRQALGGDVEEVELACEQGELGGARGLRIEGRIEERGAHAELRKCGNLVLHERNERRHDDPGARPHERRDLVAKRLARASGHEHQRVAARDHVIDDGGLGVAKLGIAERVAKDLVGAIADGGQ